VEGEITAFCLPKLSFFLQVNEGPNNTAGLDRFGDGGEGVVVAEGFVGVEQDCVTFGVAVLGNCHLKVSDLVEVGL
jgi:hypothetical protein